MTDTPAPIERVLDSIEAVAHGQGAMAARENGLGDRGESYVTNAATRNLLKRLVREGRAALTEARSTPAEPLDDLDEETAIHRIIDVIDNDEGGAELYEAALMLYRARLSPHTEEVE